MTTYPTPSQATECGVDSCTPARSPEQDLPWRAQISAMPVQHNGTGFWAIHQASHEINPWHSFSCSLPPWSALFLLSGSSDS
jgi:hypothetical protein